MWVNVSKEEVERLLPIAYNFIKDHLQYGASMKKVADTWKYGCENFLSDIHINRKAWIGHAACSFELGLPEVVVRNAWGMLTDKERYLANKEADKCINYWEHLQILKQQKTQLYIFDEKKNREIYKNLGESVLFKRNTGSVTN